MMGREGREAQAKYSRFVCYVDISIVTGDVLYCTLLGWLGGIDAIIPIFPQISFSPSLTFHLTPTKQHMSYTTLSLEADH